jgi:YbbR domain-containing protein
VRLVSLVFHNFLYKLVSIVVAVVLWSATQGFRAVDVSVDLPVEFQDAPSDLVIVGPYTREVNFKIAGSRWAVRRAVQKLQRYPISLEGFKPGDHRFEVTPDLLNLPRGATILARAPTNITVKLDAMVEKAVRVRAVLIGDPPPGLKIEVEVEPSVITLRGARTVLNNLREVVTEAIDLSEFRATTSRELPLALDSNIWPADKKSATVRVLVRVGSDRPQEDPLEAVPGAGQS